MIYSICQWTSTNLLKVWPWDKNSHPNTRYLGVYLDHYLQRALVFNMNYHLVDLYIWNVTWFKNGPTPHNPQKRILPTRYTTEKSHGLHDIKTDISKLAYHHPRRFLWAFRPRGWVSGTGLMVNSKRIAIFAVKKTKWSENQSGLRLVSTFCKSLTSLCQNSCLTDQHAQRE